MPERMAINNMGMTLTMNAEPGFLHVAAAGEFSLDEAKRTFTEMLGAAVRHKSEKVLFDGRQLTGEPAAIERFFYGEFAALAVAMSPEFRTSRVPRFAYVLEVPVLDPRRFGETVATNRGMAVKVFDNLEEARRWLGLEPGAGDA
jgi:hypothetical protein